MMAPVGGCIYKAEIQRGSQPGNVKLGIAVGQKKLRGAGKSKITQEENCISRRRLESPGPSRTNSNQERLNVGGKLTTGTGKERGEEAACRICLSYYWEGHALAFKPLFLKNGETLTQVQAFFSYGFPTSSTPPRPDSGLNREIHIWGFSQERGTCMAKRQGAQSERSKEVMDIFHHFSVSWFPDFTFREVLISKFFLILNSERKM